MLQPETSPRTVPAASSAGSLRRSVVIGLTAFLTLVDLFAAQAILPDLAARYHVSPATMGVAVNASTLGMAIASLGVARFSAHLKSLSPRDGGKR